MTSLISDAISAIMCMMVAVMLAPLAKTIYDQGAPWGLAAVLFGVGCIGLLGMLYFLGRIAVAQMRGKGRRRKVTGR